MPVTKKKNAVFIFQLDLNLLTIHERLVVKCFQKLLCVFQFGKTILSSSPSYFQAIASRNFFNRDTCYSFSGSVFRPLLSTAVGVITDAEIKMHSAEKLEYETEHFQTWSRSKYSFPCFDYC